MEDFNINIKSKIIILCLIFCLIFTVSAVSANSNATDNQVIMTDLNVDTAICGVDTFESDNVNIYTATDVVNDTSEQKTLLSAGNHENILSTETDEKDDSGGETLLESNEKNSILDMNNFELLGVENSKNELLTATGTDLENEVKNGGKITLQYSEYTLNSKHINLKSNTIIEGNGAIITCSNTKSGFLISNVNNITINNITVLNSNGQNSNGFITVMGSKSYDINITNNIFRNVKASWGSAVYVKHDSDYVHNVNIINCTIEQSTVNAAGAINIAHNIKSGQPSIFTSAPYDNHIINCTFLDCTAKVNGGAIEFMSVNSTIENCKFIH